MHNFKLNFETSYSTGPDKISIKVHDDIYMKWKYYTCKL